MGLHAAKCVLLLTSAAMPDNMPALGCMGEAHPHHQLQQRHTSSEVHGGLKQNPYYVCCPLFSLHYTALLARPHGLWCWYL
jgi:hypothetical protein